MRKKKTLYTNQAPVVPNGHVPMRNNLAAPILFQGRAIGLLNLANKETDYTEADCEMIGSITNRVAPILYAWVQRELHENERKLMEAELRRWNEQLEQRVADRTEQLTHSIDRLQDEMTRRVLAEGKLRKNSRMLEGFFQHTITPLAFLDCRFNFVRVNDAYARANARDPKYFPGKNHFELYPHEENQAIFEQVVRTKQPYRAYANRSPIPTIRSA
jgi:PAS domain-containing protein